MYQVRHTTDSANADDHLCTTNRVKSAQAVPTALVHAHAAEEDNGPNAHG